MIISFEGLDKSGKHTHSHLLKDYLESEGFCVDIISFPNYESGSGKLIRMFLDKKLDLDMDTLFYLNFINKYEVMKDYKQKLKDDNYILIIDRYILSQIVYNGVRDSRLVSLLPFPDLVVFMDVDVETSMKRKGKFGYNDRFEEDKEFLNKVYNDYKYYIYKDDENELYKNCIVVDGKKDKKVVSDEIKEKVIKFISERSDY